MSEPIMVWRFNDAPRDLQDLSPHGGDEDWLAVVPAVMAGEWIEWLDHGPFGCCDISHHQLPDGRWVHIGAHA